MAKNLGINLDKKNEEPPKKVEIDENLAIERVFEII